MLNATPIGKNDKFEIEDIEYVRHGEEPQIARVFKPFGKGPFPAIIECHGGAWCMSDRFSERVRHEYMASNGIVSIALDFRSGFKTPYPGSIQDINFAIRWAKANSDYLKTRPDMFATCGQSSGGHLAMLVAMKPNDPRYAAIPLQGGKSYDASIACVMMCWPVINPLSRYRHGGRLIEEKSDMADWAKQIMGRQDSYWRTQENMEEGNPLLALERGERILAPPAIWFQARGDRVHDYKDPASDFPGNEPQRFVERYRKAGGEIELEYIDMDHAGHAPDLTKTGEMLPHMVDFIKKHIRG